MPVLGAATAATAPTLASPLMAGADYWGTGNSYAANYGAANSCGYTQRVTKVLGSTIHSTGFALGGTYMPEIALLSSAHLYGTFGGIVTCHGVINDVNADGGNPTKVRAGFQNGLTLLIANARAKGLWGGATSPGFAFGAATDSGGSPAGAFAVTLNGTWGSDFSPPKTGNYAPGDGLRYTTTNGDSVDITLNGKECVIVVSGYDTAVSGTTGATYTVTQGGTTLITGTTNNQFLTNTSNPTAAATSGSHLPIPIKVTCATAGPNTIRLTNTSGGRLALWYVLVPHEQAGAYTGGYNFAYRPKTVLIHKQGYLPSAGYGNGATDATVDLYNGLIDSVIASFGVPATELQAVTPTGWDKTKMVGGDNLHPNDYGYQCIANAELAAISALPFRLGQNYAT